MTVGRLERVPLREVWKHEAADFTRWLQENIDVLTDVTGISLSNVLREQSAGSFSVDLIAQDPAGGLVVIENQLERSDHDHLGKLITYVTAYEATTAFWIVSEPRPEHVSAVTRLNQSGFAMIYLLKLEAVKIADSLPAPILTLIVGPSAESRAVGETKQEIAEDQNQMMAFWRQLLERAAPRIQLHANTKPGRGWWCSADAGRTGLSLNYIIRADDARVELYIETSDIDINRRLFEWLFDRRELIESTMSRPVVWRGQSGKQAFKVEVPVRVGGHRIVERWASVQDAMIDAMIEFEMALRPHIDQMPDLSDAGW